MKQQYKKQKSVVKGAPSGFVISLMVHAAAFLLAGMLVVFTVTQKEEKKFVPPKPVDRPKMKLKKPQVKVKKTAKPKATTRIVTKVKRASMPDIQLPEMSGVSDGLAGGIGGFEMMPDIGDVSVFGSGQTIGNDFVGTFYDFKRDRRGRPIPIDPDAFRQELKEFVRSGWKTSKIARYYRSPKKLYATTFAVPPVLSSVAPAAFDEADTLGYCWMAHYKGQLVHKDGITFRFWGMGDDVMVIRVDGKIVLNACWPGDTEDYFTTLWQSSSADSRRYRLGNNDAVVGDWITLEPGKPLDMEVIIGEVPGGVFCAMLVVQVEGEEYESNFQGGPILPIFKTAEPSLDLVEAIHGDLVEGEACVTNGPVFSDYDPRLKGTTVSQDVEPSPSDSSQGAVPEQKMRLWSLGEKVLEAEFTSVMGDKVVLKDAKGKQIKFPMSQLSAEDRNWVELELPPKFTISFSKQSTQRLIQESPFNERDPPRILDYVFGAKLKQKSAGIYNHELNVEFFAVGEEIDGDNYILLDRQASNFAPTKENQQSHEFRGKTVPLIDFDLTEQRRGEKYGGYLVIVSDARGKIIDHGTSHDWLFENLENLKKIPVGKHFNKDCIRVGPPRPKRNY